MNKNKCEHFIGVNNGLGFDAQPTGDYVWCAICKKQAKVERDKKGNYRWSFDESDNFREVTYGRE